MNNIEIKIAKNAGFCFGVTRAVDLVEKALGNEKEQVYCWGDLIHNPVMMNNLKEKGLKVVTDLKDFKNNSVFVVRSHGITLEDLNLVKQKTQKIINTTCPFVKKAQKQAEELKASGYKILIIGDKEHVEVKGINSRAKNEALIIGSPEDLDLIKDQLTGKIGIICQTTQKKSKLIEISNALREMKVDFEVFDTICLDTTEKQKEVNEIDADIDSLIVIGGLHSSNTTKLAEIGRAKKIKTYHIEKADDILKKWFFGVKKVFLTAGASTHPLEMTKTKNIIENFDF